MMVETQFLDKLVDRMRINPYVNSLRNVEKLRSYGNIIQWVERGFGINSLYNYKGQYKTLRDFYELLCPNCADESDSCCEDKTPEQLKREVLLELDWEEEIFRCPICSFVRERLQYDTLALCVGMRSGKSVTGAMIGGYTTMMWFALGGRLERRFNLIPGQRLRISMVCTSGTQTERTVWGAYCALINNMQDRTLGQVLKDGKLLESKSGKLLEFNEASKMNTVEWKFDNLEILSLHSNSGSLAGGTALLVILDEWSRFDLGESKRSANEVFEVLDRSLKTVRIVKKTAIDDLFGRMIVVGSPFYAGEDKEGLPIDPTLRLVKVGGSKQLGINLPTWKFNPLYSRDDFNDEYNRDFWRAERDYGANPRGGSELFFEDVDNAILVIKNGNGIKFSSIEEFRGAIKFITGHIESYEIDRFGEYAIHVDLAVSSDKLSMAIAKLEEGKIKVVGILVLKPEKGLRIWLDTPLEIILELKSSMRIKLVTYDNWNSVSAIQRLIAEGVEARKRSIGEQELLEFKKLVNLNLVDVINTGDGGANELRSEMKSLRRVAGKLSHTDVLMSVTGAVTNWSLKEVEKKTKGMFVGNSQQMYSPKVVQFRRW